MHAWVLDKSKTLDEILGAEGAIEQNARAFRPATATMTVRSVFVIGPDKTVKLMITYPASTGRNFDEILRVIDSLQLTAYKKVATPANWVQGEDVVISPAVSNEDAATMFEKGLFL